jgi:hypothetical protein
MSSKSYAAWPLGQTTVDKIRFAPPISSETRAVGNPYCNLQVIAVWNLSQFQSLLVSALSDPQNLTGST